MLAKESAEVENSPKLSGKSYHLKLLIFVFVCILLLAIGAIINHQSPRSNQTALVSPTISQAPRISSKDFFFFSIPKPIRDIALNDLPNNANPYNVVRHNGHLWFAGDGSIIEYNTKNGKLVSYSNPKKGNCNSNIAIASGYLFTSCSMKDVKEFDQDYTGKHEEDLRYAIFKIDPTNHEIKHIFTPKDGLFNTNNYVLYPDGNILWVATGNGVGRIDAKTNQVKFFIGPELGMIRRHETPEEASKKPYYPITTMLIDKDHVWANVAKTFESSPPDQFRASEALSVYNKKTKTWKMFSTSDLKEYRDWDFTLLGIKSVPGGIQIAFEDHILRDYRNRTKEDRENYWRFIEKEYLYSTNKWTLINDQPFSGENHQKAWEHLSSKYQTRSPYETPFNAFYPPSQPLDEYGLTQLLSPDSSETFQLDGRNNLILSPMIGDKRYILTNATIDVIDDTSHFRQLLIKLGTRPDAIAENIQNDIGRPVFHNYTQFLIEPETLLAVVIDRGFGGMIGLPLKISIVDLKTKKIVKEHISAGVLSESIYGEGLIIEKDDNLLVIKDKNGRLVFNINATSYNLSF